MSMDLAELGLRVDADGFIRATAAMDKFDSAASRVESSAAGITREADQMNRALLLLGGAFSGAAIVAGFSSAARVTREFSQTIADLSAITGATGADLEYYRQQAAEIGATTSLSASEAAEAFKLIAGAKPDLLDSAEALASVTREAVLLAEATGMALPAAAEAIGSAMNQFQLASDQADEVVNLLAESARLGTAEVEAVTQALRNSGSAAQSLGVDLAETVAGIQALAAAGRQGSDAGTALRQVLLRLEATGSNELMPSVVGLSDALNSLAGMQLSNAQLMELFGQEAFTAATSLIAQREVVDELSGALWGTNTAMEQAAVRMDTLNGDILNLESAIEGLAIRATGGDFESLSRQMVQLATDGVNGLTASFGVLTDAAAILAIAYSARLVPAMGTYIKAKYEDVAATRVAAEAARVDAFQRNLQAAATLSSARAVEARAVAEVANVKAIQSALSAERQLEGVRLQAQITEQGRVASIARLSEVRMAEVNIARNVAAAESALAAAHTKTIAAESAATASAERLAAARGTIGLVSGGLSRAWMGLIGVLGGPFGAALTVAAGGLYLWSQRASEAERAALDLTASVDSLSSSYVQLGLAQREQARIDLAQQMADNARSLAEVQRELALASREQLIVQGDSVSVYKASADEIRALQNEHESLIATQQHLLDTQVAFADMDVVVNQKWIDGYLELSGMALRSADALDEAGNAAGSAAQPHLAMSDAVRDLIKSLQDQVAMLGMTEREAFVYEKVTKLGTDASAELREEVELLAGALFDGTEAHRATTRAAEEAARAVEYEKRAIGTLLDELFPAVKAQKEFETNVRLLDAALAGSAITHTQYQIGLERLTRELNSATNGAQAFIEKLALEQAMLTMTERQQAILGVTMAAATAGTWEQVDAQIAAINAYYDAKGAIDVATSASERAAAQAERDAQRWATTWARGIERVRDVIGDYFQRIIVDGDLSFRTLLDSFKRLIAEMMATAAANRIMLGVGLGSVGSQALASEASVASGMGGLASIGGIFNSAGVLMSNGMVNLSHLIGASTMVGQGLLNVYGDFARMGTAMGFSGGGSVLAGGLATAGIGYLGKEFGTMAGEALFGKQAESAWGATLGGIAGTFLGGPLGTAIGSMLGGALDAALGGDGKRRVTLGVETDPRVLAGARGFTDEQIRAESGLLLSARATRADEAAANELLRSYAQIDSALTDYVERSTGRLLDLTGKYLQGSSSQAGLAVQDSGINSFFGSADFNALNQAQLADAAGNFIKSWLETAEQAMGQTLPMAQVLRSFDGPTDQLLQLADSLAGLFQNQTAIIADTKLDLAATLVGFKGDGEALIAQVNALSRLFSTEGLDPTSASLERVVSLLTNLEAPAEHLQLVAAALGELTAARDFSEIDEIAGILEKLEDMDARGIVRMSQAISVMLGEGMNAIQGLSSAMEILSRYEGSATGLLQLAEGLGSLLTMAGINPVQVALEDHRRAGMSLLQTYGEITTRVRQLTHDYDGSLAATQSLTQALAAQQDTAYQLASAFLQVQQQVDGLFGGLAESIRTSLMSEEDLYAYQRDQVTALTAMLSTLSDPNSILSTAQEIERRVSEMWGRLDADQRAAMGADFLSYIDQTAEIAQKRLREGMDSLTRNQDSINESIRQGIDDAAARMSNAAEMHQMSVERFGAYVEQFGAYASAPRAAGEVTG